jgi:signal transduction histidine kinase
MMKREMGPLTTGATPREQRLAAAGRVAAALLHEWRNVLAPISNIAFVLEHQSSDPAKVQELARRLTELTRVQGRVAERLRDFVQQDAARFPDDADVDLSKAARDAVALCRGIADLRTNGGVALECALTEPLPVRGDATALRTAIYELILNSLDALPDGGVINVRTWETDGHALLEVRDNGRGLREGMADLVFDPFISSKEALDAGLGLSAAWGIVHRHEGELNLGTHADGGTSAVLKLRR